MADLRGPASEGVRVDSSNTLGFTVDVRPSRRAESQCMQQRVETLEDWPAPLEFLYHSLEFLPNSQLATRIKLFVVRMTCTA